ncbi:MAG: glycosyltransferase, partial [Candidatus Aenigmarchaeota archaeon]|nr:glycosyltransferase [Candidatus Aenigmarchaeota archaeon]
MIIAVMPAYNEEGTITRAVEETKRYVDKIIVVNDASADATATLARRAGAIVVS